MTDRYFCKEGLPNEELDREKVEVDRKSENLPEYLRQQVRGLFEEWDGYPDDDDHRYLKSYLLGYAKMVLDEKGV